MTIHRPRHNLRLPRGIASNCCTSDEAIRFKVVMKGTCEQIRPKMRDGRDLKWRFVLSCASRRKNFIRKGTKK